MAKKFILDVEKLRLAVSESKTLKEVAQKLGFNPNSWRPKSMVREAILENKICTRHFLVPLNRYTIKELKAAIAEEDTQRKVMIRLGYHSSNNVFIPRVLRDIQEHKIDISKFRSRIIGKHTLESVLKTVFTENAPRNVTSNCKRILYEHGFKEEKCEICGLGPSWNNKHLTLQTHHKNGNRTDNRIYNLQILCPNCHSQTENYCSRNIKESSQ